MQGVTTAIVAFIFLCVVWPHLVKNRPQFYAALGAVILILLLDAIAGAARDSAGFRAFAYTMTGLLQVAAILLLFLSAGGITPRELFSDMGRAIEVIRRGEEEKEILIPRSDQPYSPPAGRADPEEERVVWEIKDDDFEPKPGDASPQQPPKDDRGTLPLD